MSAFTEAIDALFADANLGIDAVYRATGADPGVPMRVILRRPDRIVDFSETRIVAETVVIDVRVGEVASLTEGDTVEVDGTVYVIQGTPRRDEGRLIWTMEARPA